MGDEEEEDEEEETISNAEPLFSSQYLLGDQAPLFIPLEEDEAKMDPTDIEDWKRRFPNLPQETLQKLCMYPKHRDQLDVLYEAGALHVLPNINVFFSNQSGTHQMFLLQSVGSKEEVEELSALQAASLLLNLLLPKKHQNVRGWNVSSTGMHEQMSALREAADMCHHTTLVHTILKSLLAGLAVFERRFIHWVEDIAHGTEALRMQREVSSTFEEHWEGKHGTDSTSSMKVPIHLELSKRVFFSIGDGTFLHYDQSDLGLSLVFYLGWGWEPPKETD
jgi:hypothetical protein